MARRNNFDDLVDDYYDEECFDDETGELTRRVYRSNHFSCWK